MRRKDDLKYAVSKDGRNKVVNITIKPTDKTQIR